MYEGSLKIWLKNFSDLLGIEVTTLSPEQAMTEIYSATCKLVRKECSHTFVQRIESVEDNGLTKWIDVCVRCHKTRPELEARDPNCLCGLVPRLNANRQRELCPVHRSRVDPNAGVPSAEAP